MKLLKFAVPCMAALLAAAPSLRADTVSVSIWEVPAFQSVPVPGSPVYTTAPTFTGTVSNTSGTVFNMNSTNGPTDYQISNFLTSGGDTISAGLQGITTQLNTPNGCHQSGPACVTDSLFLFTGTLALTSPLVVNIMHDDGFILTLNGSTFFTAPDATSPENNTFTIPAGDYNVGLYYAEVDGAPAVLTSNIPLSNTLLPTPEPSSIALLGTGLLAAAGVVRRRLIS
jgi:hypothetical protein